MGFIKCYLSFMTLPSYMSINEKVDWILITKLMTLHVKQIHVWENVFAKKCIYAQC